MLWAGQEYGQRSVRQLFGADAVLPDCCLSNSAGAAAEQFSAEHSTWRRRRCQWCGGGFEGLPCCRARVCWVGLDAAAAAAWHRRRRLQQRRERLVLLSAAERPPVEAAAAAGSACCCTAVPPPPVCCTVAFAAHPLLHAQTKARNKEKWRKFADITTFCHVLWHFALMSTPVISCHLDRQTAVDTQTVRGVSVGREYYWDLEHKRMDWKMWKAGICALHDLDRLWRFPPPCPAAKYSWQFALLFLKSHLLDSIQYFVLWWFLLLSSAYKVCSTAKTVKLYYLCSASSVSVMGDKLEKKLIFIFQLLIKQGQLGTSGDEGWMRSSQILQLHRVGSGTLLHHWNHFPPWFQHPFPSSFSTILIHQPLSTNCINHTRLSGTPSIKYFRKIKCKRGKHYAVLLRPFSKPWGDCSFVFQHTLKISFIRAHLWPVLCFWVAKEYEGCKTDDRLLLEWNGIILIAIFDVI